jgi:GPH family glycoside/pentoside/hexuronide:cation symporter
MEFKGRPRPQRGVKVAEASVGAAKTSPGGLGTARVAAYASGGFAFNLYWQSLTLFLIFYYTDVVGLSPATAGFIYMIASVWDGAIDPIIGTVADRTRTRWGGYRPYLLFGAPVLALSFMLLYYRPPLGGGGLLAFVLVTHLGFRTCYALVNVPYLALGARITSSADKRSQISGFKMMFASLAGIAVASLTQPIAAAYGHNGFGVAAVLFAVCATIVLPIVFVSVRERTPARTDTRLISGAYWASAFKNRAFLTLIIAVTCTNVCATVWGKSVLYYYKYYIGQESAAKVGLALGAGSGLLIVPLWMAATRRIGKRTAWFVSCGFGVVGLIGFALFNVHSVWAMNGFLVFNEICAVGWAFSFWAMLPDTVEYGQLHTGVRADAFLFGLAGFFTKVSLGVGAGLFGAGLTFVGYHANHPQTAQTLAGMKALMVGVPLVGYVLASLTMIFSPLKKGEHERIVLALEPTEPLSP